MFTQEQLTNSLRATILEFPVLHQAVAIMDVETLHNDILSALPSDPIAQIHLSDPPDSRWSTDEAGFLRLDGRIYVPDLDGLCLSDTAKAASAPTAGLATMSLMSQSAPPTRANNVALEQSHASKMTQGITATHQHAHRKLVYPVPSAESALLMCGLELC